MGAFSNTLRALEDAVGLGAFQRAGPCRILVDKRRRQRCVLGVAGLTGRRHRRGRDGGRRVDGGGRQHRRRCRHRQLLAAPPSRPRRRSRSAEGVRSCRRRRSRPADTPRYRRHSAGGQHRDSVSRGGRRTLPAPCRGPVTGRPCSGRGGHCGAGCRCRRCRPRHRRYRRGWRRGAQPPPWRPAAPPFLRRFATAATTAAAAALMSGPPRSLWWYKGSSHPTSHSSSPLYPRAVATRW